MRVISGQFKGRTLIAPKGQHVRPTSDVVKETLFDILAPHLADTIWLDLFAVTGSIGIEAFSRHAAQVVFVDNDAESLRALERNLAACRIASGSTVLRGDANKMLPLLAKQQWRFDMIFLDPPYLRTHLLCDVLRRIPELGLLAPNGLLIAEHARAFHPPADVGQDVHLQQTRRIGDTALSFYQASFAPTPQPEG